jgi:hypothetical protein
MEQDIIKRAMGRANRNRLLLGLLVLAVALGAAALSLNAWRNALEGPYALSAEAVGRIETLEGQQQYYITVTGDEVMDSGWEMVRTEDGRETSRRGYTLMNLGKRQWLLIETESFRRPEETYTGVLQAISSETQVEIVDNVVRDFPELRGNLMPYMLNVREIRLENYAGMAGTALLLLAGLVLVGGVITRMSEPARHPHMKALARYGEPESIAAQIESELMMGGQAIGKHVKLTQNWLVHDQGGRFQAMKLSDLAWGYKKVTQHRSYGIPTGKVFEAQLYDRHGQPFQLTAKQEVVDDVLRQTATAAPWMLAGYDAQIERMWRKERSALIAAVDARKTTLGK